MKRNDRYKQITNFEDYNCLKGKVVDKVAFICTGNHDTQMFIILFTDKTYVCIGLGRTEDGEDFKLKHNYVPWIPPQNFNSGNFECHSWVDADGNLHFEKWIDVLRDFGIWEFTDEDAVEVIEKHKQREEEREYQQYLRLKEKFEDKEMP